jgi:adenosylhomocysteine nucleosidase
MDVEVAGLRERLQDVEEVPTKGMDFPLYTGMFGEVPVLLARCGIGKVNAALCTQYLIDHFPIAAVINSGVAGALQPGVKIGDLVVSNAAMYHDFDVIFFGYPKGVIPGLSTSTFAADERLVHLALQHGTNVLGESRVHTGLIVSGDQFVAGSEQKQSILRHFPEALCVEMEGSAIANTAYQNQVPFVILRAMSDQADDTAPADFDAYLAEVIPALDQVVMGMVAQL